MDNKKKQTGLQKAQQILTKYMGKIAGNKFLLTLRDTFIMASTPLMIAGFAIMISSVILDPANGLIFGAQGLHLGQLIAGGSNKAWLASGFAKELVKLQGVFGLVSNGTMNLNAVLIVAGFAFFGTRRFFRSNKEPIMVSLYALADFFIVLPYNYTGTTASGKTATLINTLNPTFLGQDGIFTGLIMAGLTFWIFNVLQEHHIVITMPDSVPPAVAHSFESLIPGAAAIGMSIVIASIFGAFHTTLPEAIISGLQKPALAAASTPFFAEIQILTQPLLQWFGIHGTSVWGPIDGLTWNINDNENILGKAHHIYTTLFMNFTVVSSGTLTLGPILAVLIFGKAKDQRAVAKVAIAPGIFNISEPTTYGLPIILNPIYFIPYMLSWQTNFWVGYWLTKAGLISIIVNNVPWTVPPVLSGLLYSGSWTGAAYQILATAMTIALYVPFVKINDSINEERAAKIAAGEDVGPSLKVKAQ